MALSVENDRLCFCCGPDNPHGLHLEISTPATGTAEASFVVEPRFAGWKGITHGGLLSMVLDELMAQACIRSGITAMTAEMSVRFLKAVQVDTRVRVTGTVVSEQGRVIRTEGRVYDAEGAVAAAATARFVKV
jgi:uncharacterized protein (TIGR00369 family)